MTIPQPDSVLRHRPFVLFWFARLAVTASYQMLIVAVAWQLYALTGDPFDLGLIGLIQFVPAMLLFLVVGQVTDRTDRRLLLIGCQLIEAVAAGTLLTAVLTGTMSRELILATSFILGIARAFEVTVMQIIVPSLVPLPLVPRAVAASATANKSATIAGPAVGGLLYTAGPSVMQIIVPSLVPLPVVPRAVAASATANQSATIAGPALGGLLYTAGPSVVYGVWVLLLI